MYSFLSNWDIAYYQKNLNRKTKKSVMGYRGSIENKAFFGSKMLTIPDEIRLENFSIIQSGDLVGGDANIQNVDETVIQSNTQQHAISAEPRVISEFRQNRRRKEKLKQKNKFLELKVYSDKALIKYLRSDGIDAEFIKYINPDFSFGEDGLDDDIEQYIINNVVPRYSIKRIIFYENQFANNVNSLNTIELDLSNLELLQKGYKISENVQIKISTDSPLNFKLIYTIPKLDNYSISFKVDLEKK